MATPSPERHYVHEMSKREFRLAWEMPQRRVERAWQEVFPRQEIQRKAAWSSVLWLFALPIYLQPNETVDNGLDRLASLSVELIQRTFGISPFAEALIRPSNLGDVIAWTEEDGHVGIEALYYVLVKDHRLDMPDFTNRWYYERNHMDIPEFARLRAL
jgi:hypothetical protein